MIADALRAMLPPWVSVAASGINDRYPQIYADEESTLKRAIPSRLIEFRAGRTAARLALRNLGWPSVALPVGDGRAPIWPQGICGSISHSNGIAAAAVARDDRCAGLGIDLEIAADLPPDIAASVVFPADQPRGSGLSRDLANAVIFSIKESIFKAQFPITGAWIDFDAASVILQPRKFTAQVGGVELDGIWDIQDGMIASGLVVSLEQRLQFVSLLPDIMAGQNTATR